MVIVHSYLRIKVEIPINEPLLIGYFYLLESNDELRVQFNLERLSDYCYVYGRVTHITGQCSFLEPFNI